jgi:hypothetical protein
MSDFTEADRKKSSEEKMLKRMALGPFTFSDLWTPFGASSPEYREADRLIQRERKASRIRLGMNKIWYPTPPTDAA